MHMHTIQPNMLLIAEPSLQTCMLSNYLAEELTVTMGCIQEPEQWPSSVEMSPMPKLLLIDLATVKKQQQCEWQTFLTYQTQAYLVTLLNAEVDIDIWEILKWPHCKGIFFATDLPEHLASGIRKVLEGELWLPRHILTNLYLQLQEKPKTYSRHALTHREVEILNRLKMGLSNCQIASDFFISENTIKSHIYRIFKKIGVHNRVQAVKWAQDNLPS